MFIKIFAKENIYRQKRSLWRFGHKVILVEIVLNSKKNKTPVELESSF